MNYPESTGPNDPSAPWNAEERSKEQEKLIETLMKIEIGLTFIRREIEELEMKEESLQDQRTELRERIWDSGLDPDDVLDIE